MKEKGIARSEKYMKMKTRGKVNSRNEKCNKRKIQGQKSKERKMQVTENVRNGKYKE